MSRRGVVLRVIATLGTLLLCGPTTRVAAAETPLQARLFKLKYQTSNDVHRAIRSLGSGKEGTKIDEASAFESIAVLDHPTHVAAIAQAIKLLDVPSPDVELSFHILIATPDAGGSVPASLSGVVAQLKKSLKYQGYHQIAGLTQRVKAGTWTKNEGTARVDAAVDGEASTTHYEFKLRTGLETGKGGRAVIIRGLDFEADNKRLGNVDISTDFSVREDETVVVGTAGLDRGRAVILLVSANIL